MNGSIDKLLFVNTANIRWVYWGQKGGDRIDKKDIGHHVLSLGCTDLELFKRYISVHTECTNMYQCISMYSECTNRPTCLSHLRTMGHTNVGAKEEGFPGTLLNVKTFRASRAQLMHSKRKFIIYRTSLYTGVRGCVTTVYRCNDITQLHAQYRGDL